LTQAGSRAELPADALPNYFGVGIGGFFSSGLLKHAGFTEKPAVPSGHLARRRHRRFRPVRPRKQARPPRLHGSDWCGWCKRIDAKVLTQKPFLDYARDQLVLLRVDFPRGFKLPEATRLQNDTLSERYQVSGYPTLVLIDSNGREIARTGYMYGGAKTFVRWVKTELTAH
jgi:hypothetical protein